MNPDILNTILPCLGGLLFCLGWVWLNKTEDDEVLASHINELQDKKVDTDLMGYKARGYLNADQDNIPNTTVTKILLNAETYDPGDDFDADGADSDYTAPVTGYYLIIGQIQWNATVANKLYRAYIYVNGAGKSMNIVQSAAVEKLTVPISDILHVALGETIDLRGYHNAGAATPDVLGHATGQSTYLIIHLLSI